ncbi:hypothetical protein J6590_021130 [Homalodisca vitripennis]|nr:hypothetical protein J6590_021130 [Homalodisca vitripennis]
MAEKVFSASRGNRLCLMYSGTALQIRLQQWEVARKETVWKKLNSILLRQPRCSSISRCPSGSDKHLPPLPPPPSRVT